MPAVSFDWNHTYTAADAAFMASGTGNGAFTSYAVACMFAAAFAERYRAVFPGATVPNTFNLTAPGATRGIVFGAFSTFLVPTSETWALSTFYSPYIVSGSFYPEAERVHIGLGTNASYGNVGFNYGALDFWLPVLAKAYFEHGKNFAGYNDAAMAADTLAYRNYFFPDDPDSYPHTFNGVPSPLFHKLPKWPGPNGFTRKREREISRMSDPGQEGWVARFCARGNPRFPTANYADPDGVGHCGTVDPTATWGTTGFDPQIEITPDDTNRKYPVQCSTPRGEHKYASLVMVYKSGAWTVAVGQDDPSASGATSGSSSAGSTPKPDIITAYGLARIGDIFGEWCLNERRDALNQMTDTLGQIAGVDVVYTSSSYTLPDSSVSGGVDTFYSEDSSVVTNCASGQQGIGLARSALPDTGITPTPCFCKRKTTYYGRRFNPIETTPPVLVLGESPTDNTKYQAICIDQSTSSETVEPLFSITDWSVDGGFQFTSARGSTDTCAATFPTDNCIEPGTPSTSDDSGTNSSGTSSSTSSGSNSSGTASSNTSGGTSGTGTSGGGTAGTGGDSGGGGGGGGTTTGGTTTGGAGGSTGGATGSGTGGSGTASGSGGGFTPDPVTPPDQTETTDCANCGGRRYPTVMELYVDIQFSPSIRPTNYADFRNAHLTLTGPTSGQYQETDAATGLTVTKRCGSPDAQWVVNTATPALTVTIPESSLNHVQTLQTVTIGGVTGQVQVTIYPYTYCTDPFSCSRFDSMAIGDAFMATSCEIALCFGNEAVTGDAATFEYDGKCYHVTPAGYSPSNNPNCPMYQIERIAC